MNKCPAIEALCLCKRYGTLTVFAGLGLSVGEGETVVVMGSNGAGKTTLLRCLSGSVRPTSGRVLWFGRMSAKDPEVRRSIGVVGHESYLYPNLTALENLRFAARMSDLFDPESCLARMLDDSGLRSCANRLTRELSRGLRQRVSLLRALVHEPRILLWDEPFAGLDSQAVDWLLELLRAQRLAGRTICLALHDAQLACRLADRIVVLKHGRLGESDLALNHGRVA